VGSGNGLARALALPLRPAAALAALENGVRRRIDVGRLNRGLFLNVAGTGFDAVVGAAFQRAGQDGSRRGFLGYVRLSLAEVFRFRPRPLVLTSEGESRDLTPFIVTFANGPQYGSGAVINPGGKLDDGRLEAVFFRYAGLGRVLAAAPRLFVGGLERARGYGRVSATRFTVTAESPLAIHRDGDPVESAAHIDVELLPRALNVVAPAATIENPDGPFSRDG
jgi:diacylglycerol kinase family enzyme